VNVARHDSPPDTSRQFRRAAIALGSNLGDRRANLASAIARLSLVLSDLVVSSIAETLPVGEGLEREPLFLNAAAVGTTSLDARSLLDELLSIERELGRERPYPGAARTIDLDLILLGDVMIHEPGLRVPHPRFRERRFVLEPLAEIAPELRDPMTGRSVAQLAETEKARER
jgi:2-amino-4-hydroxy-6-hydroxymethyldihydropteridine diphosphokinase